MKSTRLIFLFLGYLIGLCSTNAEAQQERITREYGQFYFHAIVSENNNDIEDSIKTIDDIYLQYKNFLPSIYYNKAQLLVKIGKYNEAIETIKLDMSDKSLLFLATLYYRIDRFIDSEKIMKELCTDYRRIIFDLRESERTRIVALNNLLYLNILLDQDSSFIIAKLDEDMALPKKIIEEAIKTTKVDKNTIIFSIWPK